MTARNRMLVYVSGPYSSDPERNVAAAIDAAERLYAAGYAPYVPHLSHYWHLRHPHSRDEWLSLGLEWLRVCGAVVRLPGESRGADLEVREAKRLGIPVYPGVEAFLAVAGRQVWVSRTGRTVYHTRPDCPRAGGATLERTRLAGLSHRRVPCKTCSNP